LEFLEEDNFRKDIPFILDSSSAISIGN
jgi:hypothetical protein